jgi:hypothetical protein
VGILERNEQATKYLKVVSIGLLYLRMQIIFANHMKNAKEQTISLHKNQMPLTNIFVNEFFMFGVLILLVHFLLLLVIFISFLLLIMCPNGLR